MIINRDHKSKETRVVAYICRYFNPYNSAIVTVKGLKLSETGAPN